MTELNFKKLTATVEQTGEHFVLYDGVDFLNFEKLEKLVGKDFDSLNDDLMNGPSETTWYGTDPMNPTYTKYEKCEPILTIRFAYTI